MNRFFINNIIKEAVNRKIPVVNGMYAVRIRNKEVSVNGGLYEVFDILTYGIDKVPVNEVERVFSLC